MFKNFKPFQRTEQNLVNFRIAFQLEIKIPYRSGKTQDFDSYFYLRV